MSFGPTRNNRGAGNAGEQLVQFRLGDAQRISDAVQTVESMRRQPKPSFLPRSVVSDSSKDHLMVKVPSNSLDIPHEALKVGHGIALNNLFLSPNGMLLSTELSAQASSEEEIPAHSTTLGEITAPTDSIGPGVRCGVIEQVSELQENSFYMCRVRVRGMVRCRVLFLTQGASVSPPPPLPTTVSLQKYWRRYLLATDYGYGSIIAVGSRFSLNDDGQSMYPSVAEALVMLG